MTVLLHASMEMSAWGRVVLDLQVDPSIRKPQGIWDELGLLRV